MQGGIEDAQKASHSGIFRSSRVSSQFLTKPAEPQESSQTSTQGTDTQNMSKSYHANTKGRFETKRGWLTEVYTTKKPPSPLQVADSASSLQVSQPASLLDHSISSRQCFHPAPPIDRMPNREPPELKWRSCWSPRKLNSEEKEEAQQSLVADSQMDWTFGNIHFTPLKEEKQQAPVTDFKTDLPDANPDSKTDLPDANPVNMTESLEQQSRDDQIKAVKEALLRSPGVLSDKLDRKKTTAQSTTFSPPARKKTLRHRSERTASLPRRKTSAFGEIRAADREICDLAQDLRPTLDDKVDEKTKVIQIQDSECAPRYIGDRVQDSLEEMRGLEGDVDQLTRDLRALKQLLRREA